MEFIDFLSYGAIGISLALAILSYRLLTKEQNSQAERPLMLKQIKNFLWVAVFLSVFFGLMELTGQIIQDRSGRSDTELEKIWDVHFSHFPDSTVDQKADRIADFLVDPPEEIDTTVICRAYIDELEQLKTKLAGYDIGFYENIVKLKNQLKLDPDGWSNLDHQIESKNEIVSALKNIFRSLGFNYDDLTNEEIVGKWKSYKSSWETEQLGYIFNSDISQLVKKYVDTFGE